MAEGDTILRLARRIEAELGGQKLSASAPNPRGRAGGVERLDGRRLDWVEARGKHLLLHFDGLVLHSHLGMSGGWQLYDRGARWRRAPDFDPAPVVAAMRADPSRTLGDALLDQHLVAGIGNIFKSEACFAAGVDPWRLLGELSDAELEAVLLAARAEMLKAVATGRHAPKVYRRRGPCPRCGARIESRGQGDANRTTYWCPGCQR